MCTETRSGTSHQKNPTRALTSWYSWCSTSISKRYFNYISGGLGAGRRSYENDQNQCKVDTRMAGGWEEEQWDSDQKLNEQWSSVWLNIQYSFNDRISVLIILLQGSVDALHYTVTATVDFVLGMYFNLTSYLCHSPVTPQAELVYWAAITGPWKLVCFRYFKIQCISNIIVHMNCWHYSTNHAEQHKSLAQVYFSRVIIKVEVG